MDQTSPTPQQLDLTRIDDPEVRRAMRALCQHVTGELQRQQLEIETLLELMIDKHVTSLGEFKVHLQRIAQGGARTARLAEAMCGAPAAPAPRK
jgi:hypothetical protein